MQYNQNNIWVFSCALTFFSAIENAKKDDCEWEYKQKTESDIFFIKEISGNFPRTQVQNI